MVMAEGILEGRRLVLRPLAEADAAELGSAVADSREALRKRLGWAAPDPAPGDAAAFIAAVRAAAEARTALSWGVFEAKGGALAGVASLDELQPAERGHARLALWVRTGRTDRGYATEAGRLVVEHAFKTLALRRLSARLDPVNRAFRRVLKRLGFRYEGCLRADKRLNNRWIDQECWGMLRSDRAPAKPTTRKK
ncbi:MAG: GNAT family N-acetyltransferase [Elusimicrobia bacterium]|nr:GNAT family N-acetyltransferase [Elusimicrobiota bacterium]